MRSRPINLVTVLAMLVCAAAVAVWVRSFYRWDLGQYVPRDGWALSVHLGSGAADFSSSAELRGVTSAWTTDPAPGHAALWCFLFDFANYPAWLVRTPLWLPIALSAAVVVWSRRPGRPAPGRCARCGYDLRASPSRCPECGTLNRRGRRNGCPRPPDAAVGDAARAGPRRCAFIAGWCGRRRTRSGGFHPV